jgi:hypothetical protein
LTKPGQYDPLARKITTTTYKSMLKKGKNKGELEKDGPSISGTGQVAARV